MTCEEAIKIINEGVETGNCPTNLCHYSETGCGDCKWRIALYKAIEAMEKQIPKKAKIKSSAITECAECDTCIFVSDKFCPRCGQAIDWSE